MAEIISEAPNEMAGATATTSASGTTATDQANASNSLGSTPVATPTPPIQSKSTTKVKPIGGWWAFYSIFNFYFKAITLINLYFYRS